MITNFSTISERLADAYSSREAIVNIEKNRRFTFDQYHRLTNQIANMLHEQVAVDKGDRYLCILDNDNLSLFSHLTVFKGHGCACYTNYRDSVDEHALQIDKVEPKVVLIENELLPSHFEMLKQKRKTIIAMDTPSAEYAADGVLDFWNLMATASEANPNVEHDDRKDTLLLRFTGGTTGQGKCAAYSIDNWLACKDSFYSLPEPLWHPDVRMLHMAPLSHGSSMMVLATLFRGGCTITMNQPDLSAFCKNVENERINVSFLVPTVLYRLLEMDGSKKADLSTLETVYYGAAPMSPAKLHLLQNRFGNIFVQLYGATENACVAISLSKQAHLAETDEDEAHLASAGIPVPGVEVRIVDEEGQSVSRGDIGEIWLRSRAICQGYFHNAEATAKEFTQGYWKSADMGYMDEHGYVYIVDRKKDMIISGGFNIYAVEVEAAINAHPAVMMSAVIGRPHEEWGEAVHAEVILSDNAGVDETEIIDFVKTRLGRFKAPKTVIFVAELPTSVVGKVLRRNIREKYWKATDRKVS